jgi:flavin-dependent dehydrogenase
MTERYDLAVVGASVAGASAALLAARGGLNVVVVDAAQFPRQKVCGEYLTPAAWQLLAQLGVGDLRDRAVALPTMQLAADESCRLTMDFACEERAPRALSRFALDVRLVDEARRAGATVITGRRIRRVLVEHGRAVGLECAGDAEHEPGERIATRAVIAADGRRSIVVRDTGRLRRSDLGLFGFKRHVLPADTTGRVIDMHAVSGGYVGTCPTEDGSLNICGVMPRHLLQAARGDVAAALDAWLADRPTLRAQVAAAASGPWQTMPDVAQQSARPLVEGVLYVGDAQGTIEPLTGQGMTMAMAAARMAFDVLLREGPDGLTAAVQRSYEAQWRAAFATPIRAASWFGRLLRRPKLLKTMITAGRPLPGLTDLLLRSAYRRTLAVAVGTP